MRELMTERMVLRPMSLDDAPAIQRLFAQWEVVRLLADRVPWPYPEDGAFGYVRDVVLPATARGDEWHWTLRLKAEPEEVVGAIAVMRGEDDNRGFWLRPELWRQGLMTEAAAEVTRFWFEELGMERMRVPKARGNVGSKRISEKEGMRVVKVEEKGFVCGRLVAETWEITAEEWRRWNG